MKRLVLLLLFVFICNVLPAQNNAMLIPRNVYVGDPATFILSLPGSEQNLTDIILMPHSPYFPYDANIDFHRVVLERRIGGNRLIIEFTAFVPGVLQFPVIEIGGERFSDLAVTINSVISSTSSGTEHNGLELSQPVASLIMPGTALMLYGTMAALVLLLLLTIWFVLKGRILTSKLIAKWQRWKNFRYIKKTEKNLQKLLLKGENKRFILDKLSHNFRIFLSFITSDNCSAMTAGEFERLEKDGVLLDTLSLGKFFRKLDKLRFSGIEIKHEEILCLLDETHAYIVNIENTKGNVA